MADTHVTITGNLTDDPEVTFTPSGQAVCNFRLAVTPRVKDGDSWRDGDTSFFRITAWRQLAEHVGDSLSKGDRVIVPGQLRIPRLGDPRRRQALGGRGHRRGGRSQPALGDRQARARQQDQRQAGRPVQRRPTVLTLGSSEAGAELTRPGLAHRQEVRTL